MNVLVLVEHDSSKIKESTYAAISAAQKISSSIHAIVIGCDCKTVVQEASRIKGIEKVFYVDHTAHKNMSSSIVVPIIKKLAHSYTHILVGASIFGRDVMPRLAGELEIEQVSDVVEVVSQDVFVKPIYAGGAFVKIKSTDAIKLLTIRLTAFEIKKIVQEPSPVFIIETQEEKVESEIKSNQTGKVVFIKKEKTLSERPELTASRIVISIGRAIESTESFKVLKNIALKLNAAIGASKPAVEAGLLSNQELVGQTGKVVAPDLYIAVGISGATQHVIGMKDSKVIVAINKDPEAPIFKIADYGVVGDIFHLLPELDQALEKLSMEKAL